MLKALFGAVAWLGVAAAAPAVRAEGLPSLEPLKWAVNNKYTLRDGPLAVGLPAFEGKVVMEPHRESFFTVENPLPGLSYRWTIDGHMFSATAGKNNRVSVTFGRRKLWTPISFKVDEVDTAGRAGGTGIRRSAQGELVLRYIRRDLRTLFDVDREAFMVAMEELYRLTPLEGQAKYGDDFTSSKELISMHGNSAGGWLCDHLHKGMGFLSNHVAIGAQFERALQVVDPSVALHYWDYAYDYEQYGSFRHIFGYSPITSPTWFGPFGGDESELKTGRWGWLKVPMAGEDDVQNAFGLMRSAWNQDNSPYIKRFSGEFMGHPQDELGFYSSKWPSCEAFAKFPQAYHAWEDIGFQLEDSIHGPIHSLCGGATEATDEYASLLQLMQDHGHPELINIVLAFPYMSHKYLWRTGLWECPSCDPGQAPETCQCGCTSFDPQDPASVNLHAYYSLSRKVEFDDLATYSMDFKTSIANYFCNDVYISGDHMDSGSPADPSFWVVHGSVERFYQKLVIAGLGGNPYDWPAPEDSYQGVWGLGMDITGEEICYGHYADDVLSFSMEIEGRLFQPTAVEAVKATDPFQMKLPYIYDSLSFGYCEDFDVDAVIEELAGKPFSFSVTPLNKDPGVNVLAAPAEAFLLPHGTNHGLHRVSLRAMSGDGSIRWDSTVEEIVEGFVPRLWDVFPDPVTGSVFYSRPTGNEAGQGGLIARAKSLGMELAETERWPQVHITEPGVLTGDVAGRRLFWADRAGDAGSLQAISVAAMDGKERHELLTLTGRCTGMSYDGGSLYWTEDTGTLSRCSACDGLDTEAVLVGLERPSYLHVHAGEVYVLVADGTTVLRYREGMDGGAEVVTTGLPPCETVQFDATNRFLWLSLSRTGSLLGLDMAASADDEAAAAGAAAPVLYTPNRGARWGSPWYESVAVGRQAFASPPAGAAAVSQ